MSLVGSLEDLGLGDILQIISLSRKSGLLQLRSEEGEGRIVFCDGLVRAGFVKGELDDLKGLLVVGGFITESAFEKAAEIASAHGDPIDEVLATTSAISKERIDSLRREQVERSVFRMFTWTTGEFSFEVRDAIDDRDLDLLVSTGINAQYLTMEATRLGDEGGKAYDDDIQFGMVDEDLVGTDAIAEVAAEGEVENAEVAAEVENAEIADTLALAAVERVDAGEPVDAADATAECVSQVDPEPVEAPASEAAEPVDTPVATAPTSAPDPAPTDLAALIAIDPDLAALEWQKSVLGPICRRIHVFQRPEGGISRLRQYLLRGQEPVVLVSESLPADPHAGIVDSLDLVRRLRAHAPRLPIYLVCTGAESTATPTGEANGKLQRPANHQLANRRAWSKLEGEGERLRHALLERSEPEPPAQQAVSRVAGGPAARSESAPNGAHSDLQRLKRTSDRLRDPSVRGEVLSLILEFAAELFSRVAIFMVRDDEAIGMAQSGLSRADGPDDSAFREVAISTSAPAWFRSVLESGEGEQAPPRDAGDRQLAGLLGASIPEVAYVAPIESSRHVVALVYVDNLPGGDPIGDTTSLEIVLHEAGLALERALLERALAEADERGGV